MKYAWLFYVVSLAAVGCGPGDDSQNDTCRISGCHISALNYNDKLALVQNTVDPAFPGYVTFEYDHGRISKSYGGHYRFPGFPDATYILLEEAENHFSYSGDTTTVVISANSDPNPEVHRYVVRSG
ncbi:hypothetical protein [Flavobacterium selenitireducens]|uniref:hypothetical protein n=1 Tax=Flavobacterium selenitireducens TaxID=2722704 RepID=UPI00168AFC4C|nr:hypothetical protein [Flavobacterium selenitireducens]MBD3583524.1 hypothetical protein [Flavobacterium selenitireducens]